ncbi:hypothetical protein [Diadegma fenestrale ichnovirus]|nr:hypothetical protein [Diadegma fenestrale ichnovirus]
MHSLLVLMTLVLMADARPEPMPMEPCRPEDVSISFLQTRINVQVSL